MHATRIVAGPFLVRITYLVQAATAFLSHLLHFHVHVKMPYDGQVLLPTLIGSLLSCVASIFVLLCYIIYADQQRSFRHALVLNLALAGKGSPETQRTLANAQPRVCQFTEQLDFRHLCTCPS
jgi:hypothetical protein